MSLPSSRSRSRLPGAAAAARAPSAHRAPAAAVGTFAVGSDRHQAGEVVTVTTAGGGDSGNPRWSPA
ncbi:hypothetical protein [Streptomyces pacificus]|uniref:hypothetical protein n=1 Tax=Streptomyces pacificus TaxID=2705029 RepID=UPI001564186C|nr:hypothetical protein [Streptomyces pacificus]